MAKISLHNKSINYMAKIMQDDFHQLIHSLRADLSSSLQDTRENIQLKREIAGLKQRLKEYEKRIDFLSQKNQILETKLELADTEISNLKNQIDIIHKNNIIRSKQQKRPKETVQNIKIVNEEEDSQSEITDEDISALMDTSDTEIPQVIEENPPEIQEATKATQKQPKKIYSKTRTDIPTLIQMIENSNTRELDDIIQKVLIEYYPSMRAMKLHFINIINAVIMRLFHSNEEDETTECFTHFLMTFVMKVMPQQENKIKEIFIKRPKIHTMIEFFSLVGRED